MQEVKENTIYMFKNSPVLLDLDLIWSYIQLFK